MKIKSIKINSYGTLKNKEIILENNFNIIYGKNESGKSTLLNYIKNIFYGISKNKNGKEISEYEKYTPWIGEEFSGKIKYELDDKKEFEVFRDFTKKNPKIFDERLEDISTQFKIDKKDGNQFFYEQTGLDEKMYLSTIMSTQQEVVLDRPTQSILLQKVANLAGTGDDNVSFQKAMDKLGRRQLEEVGTNRTQDRPINLVQNRIKELNVVLKDEKSFLAESQKLEEKRKILSDCLEEEKKKNNAIRKLNMLTQRNQINLEKTKLKSKIKDENLEKIQKLIQEKNNLMKNNQKKIEENKLNNNSDNNLNEINLENKKIKNKLQEKNTNMKNKNLFFIILFLFSILINIINFIFIQNKIINYTILLLIPISFIILLMNCFKNKKIKNKIKEQQEKEILEEKIEKQKLQEQISNLEGQIHLLQTEVEKQENEIKQEQLQINSYMMLEKEKIKKEFLPINLSFLDLLNGQLEIENKLEESNEFITDYQLQLNHLEYEEKQVNNKMEEIISLKEEYSNLEEQLSILEEKNNCILKTKELLEKAYEKMRKNVTPKFTQNLSNLICKISDGKYTKVNISEEKGLIVELENGEYVPASLLSVGTIDQLYLSLRLAMLEEISNEKMPIILDEAFAYFDDERLKNSLLFLLEQAKKHQVILFTCTKREKELLEKLNVEYNWVEI